MTTNGNLFSEETLRRRNKYFTSLTGLVEGSGLWDTFTEIDYSKTDIRRHLGSSLKIHNLYTSKGSLSLVIVLKVPYL